MLAGIVSKIILKEKGGYEITIVNAANGRQVVDIIPLGQDLLVSEGESIKLERQKKFVSYDEGSTSEKY